jgi:uncharacterized membrane protein HdeD (DUF308 family)
MRKIESRIVIGGILIVAGLLFLLENLDIIQLGELFWGIILISTGVAFLVFFMRKRQHWWALIPGIILLDLGFLLLLQNYAPDFAELYGGGVLFAGIAVSFFAVYAVSPWNWWAIIPGGVMLTLAGITLIEPYVENQGLGVGGGFFLGLGLTFLLVYILPAPGGRNTWAIFPSAALFLMGILILVSAEELINYIWPTFLILLGVALLARNYIWKT